ncbi:MAG: hypothetical protein IPJ84_16180 [Bdellovibrionales bacterium]|nr:hypothetical protein [Bdellovibrionales bacterium]
MDLNAVARFVFEKNELLLGIFIVLFLLTTVLLLVLSVMRDKGGDGETSAAGAGGVAIDPRSLNTAIEGALKKALSDRVVAGAVATVSGETASAGGGASDVALQAALSDREAKIVALMADLDALKAHVDSHGAPVAGVGGGGMDAGELNALKARVSELQAKLAEYEIIEDDIADLSLFKDENKKLKDEVERLRAAAETAKTQIQSVQASVAAAPEVKSKIKTEAESPLKFEKSDKFELDPADDVMKEFAQALAIQSEDPFAGAENATAVGTPAEESVAAMAELEPQVAEPLVPVVDLPVVEPETTLVVSHPDAPVQDPQAAIDALLNQVDTDKMISEAESLSESADASDSETSVLDDGVDTDKLMAEMGIESEEPVAASAPAPAPVAAMSSAVATDSSHHMELSDVPVDDLLAEFKDTDFSATKADEKKGE